MKLPGRNLAAADPRDEAIGWLAREQEGRLTPDQQAALQVWLDADPAHPELYGRARSAVFAPNRYSAHPEMMDMRREALAALGHRRRRPVWAAAAAIAVMVAGAGWTVMRPETGPSVSPLKQVAAPLMPTLNPNAAIYRTAVGERTSVALPDGSVAILNTDSVLKVAYTGRERGVRLVRGQALFEVAHNKRAPFQVYAGDRRITAVGTTFDVRLDARKVKVTLVEGIVRVARVASPSASPLPAQQVTMTAGEVLEASPAAAMSVRTADVSAQTSWKAGVVVFKSATLAEAVAEVNRYTDHPVTIADPSLAGYRFTGVFRTGDPERFARSVAEVLPVDVQTNADGSLTLQTARY
jgi:transmembrane sensor